MHLSFMSGSLVPCSSCLIHSSVSLLCFFSFVQPAIRFVCLVGCHRGLEIVVNINDLHWVFHPNFFHLPWFPVAPASPSSSVFIAYVNRQGCLLRLVGIQEYANANGSHWCSFLRFMSPSLVPCSSFFNVRFIFLTSSPPGRLVARQPPGFCSRCECGCEYEWSPLVLFSRFMPPSLAPFKSWFIFFSLLGYRQVGYYLLLGIDNGGERGRFASMVIWGFTWPSLVP